MPDRFDEVMRGLERLSDRIDQMKKQLVEIAEMVSDLEYRSLTPDEKAEREFDGAKEINVKDLRSLPAGSVLRLIALSWHYPSEEPDVETFEYRHDQIVEGNATQWGTIVQGWRRFTESAEWSPYRFYASDENCTTSDCAGTIRQRR